MKNHQNTQSEISTIENLVNEWNSLIFDEEIWIKKELWKIAEVTYSYDKKTWVNITLFVKWWWLDLELFNKSDYSAREKLITKAKQNIENIIENKIDLIDSFLNKIPDTNNKIETNLKEIFENSLIEKRNFLKYCLLALPFEIEKAWIENPIGINNQVNAEMELQAIDHELFWWEIKSNSQEAIMAYEYIYEKYRHNRAKLSPKEKSRFINYLSHMRDYLPSEYRYIKKEKPKEIDTKFLEYELNRSDYILSFNLIIEALEKLKHLVESNDEIDSISDWPNWFQIPTSEKFDSMNILRFLLLNSHETLAHNVSDHNSRQLMWNLRWSGSTEKDEWIAMLLEQLFKYWEELYKIDNDWDKIIDIKKVQINSYFSKTFAWEIFNSDQLLDFLELSEKIDTDVISPKARFDRLKRNNKTYVQHKDTTYTRWLLKAVNQINKFIKSKWKEWINPIDLFIGKISFDETYKLKSIKEEKEKNWEKIELVKPLFISDAIYFVINEKLNGNKWDINHEKFYDYLKKKYSIFDFSLEEVKKVSYTTKSNVYAIVNVLLKNIGQQQVYSFTSDRAQINSKINSIIAGQYDWAIEHRKKRMHPSRRKAK